MLKGVWDGALKISTTVVFFIAGISWALYRDHPTVFFYGFRAFFTVGFYQLSVRIVISIYYRHVHNWPWNPHSFWFRERAWEKPLYRALRVKRWKDFLPTNRPGDFDIRTTDIAGILNNSCRAEAVHATNNAAGYLPLLLTCLMTRQRQYLSIALFIAVGFGIADSILALIQRYNRPRLLRLLDLMEKSGRLNSQ